MTTATAGAITEHFVDHATPGEFSLVRVQDCDKIIEGVKDASDLAVRRANTQSFQRYLGSVPCIIALEWSNEWGVRLYSKEWTQKARHRLLHDPNWRLLRAS